MTDVSFAAKVVVFDEVGEDGASKGSRRGFVEGTCKASRTRAAYNAEGVKRRGWSGSIDVLVVLQLGARSSALGKGVLSSFSFSSAGMLLPLVRLLGVGVTRGKEGRQK